MRRPGMCPNIWIEKMAAEVPEEPPEQSGEGPVPNPMTDPRWRRIYGPLLRPLGLSDHGAAQAPLAGALLPPKAAPAPTNEISVINLTCRAVSWNRVRPIADTELAWAFLRQLQASPYSQGGTNGTQLTGVMERNEQTGTFSFEAKFKLKKPLKLVL